MKQEALWATYLTRRLGASRWGQLQQKTWLSKITVPLDLN